MQRGVVLSFSFLAATVIATGCSTVGVRVPVTRPAEINLSAYKNLSVGPFEGVSRQQTLLGALVTAVNALSQNSSGGGIFQTNWRGSAEDGSDVAQFMQQSVMGANRFTLVDFSQIPTFRLAGTLKEPTLLVTGRVNYQEASDKVENESYTDNQKKNHTRYSRNVEARYEVNLQLVDLTNGQVFLTRTYPCTRRETTRETDKLPPNIDKTALFRSCKEEIAAIFAKAIAPYQEMVVAYFRKEKSLPAMEEGIRHAESGNWSRSVEVFKGVTDSLQVEPMEVQAKAWWNLGLAYEYGYQLDQAREALQRANSLAPDGDIIRELANVDRLAREREQLKTQEFKGNRS